MAIEETIQAINMPGFTRKSCHSKRGIGSIAMQKIAFRIKGIGRNCILEGKKSAIAQSMCASLEPGRNVWLRMVLLGRFELPASPLPRECSTPELQQHRALAVRAGYRPLAGNWSSPNYAKIFDLARMVQFCWSRLHSASEYSIKARPLEPETYWQDDSTAKQAISRDQ